MQIFKKANIGIKSHAIETEVLDDIYMLACIGNKNEMFIKAVTVSNYFQPILSSDLTILIQC